MFHQSNVMSQYQLIGNCNRFKYMTILQYAYWCDIECVEKVCFDLMKICFNSTLSIKVCNE